MCFLKLFTMFFLCSCLEHDDFGSKPNIIFFMADDLGWHNVQWHNKDMKTPNAMRLLQEGIKLDRKYAYPVCSPSRSAFMSGRLPFHVQQQNYQNCDLSQGVPRNMTFISAKLKSAGYATHSVGKWHLGTYSHGHTPKGRGFDTSLIYFEGAEDHWTQRSCQDPECIVPIPNNATSHYNPLHLSPHDLWENDGPAHSLAGTQYNGHLFNNFAVNAIQNHHTEDGPMFMYLAPANSHTPLQVPDEYLELYPEDWYIDRRQYAAMCTFWDDILGNITIALKEKEMWDNTLFVFSSDNGGPTYWSLNKTFQHGAGANNWPLRGSKAAGWEGGIRVVSFVSGGFVPSNMRGKTLDGYIHMSDWYATFAHLAGVDPTDTVVGLPDIDSMNMWGYISGRDPSSPRTEIPAVINAKYLHMNVSFSILIQDEWKLLLGEQYLSYWQGPEFPNKTSPPYGVITDPKLVKLCFPFCLYNIRDDPNETKDVARENFAVGMKMKKRVEELQQSVFQRESNEDTERCQLQVTKNGNFYGPWLP